MCDSAAMLHFLVVDSFININRIKKNIDVKSVIRHNQMLVVKHTRRPSINLFKRFNQGLTLFCSDNRPM